MLIAAHELTLEGQRSEHIVEACTRWMRGEVPDQSKKWAPTTSELLDEVKARAESERLRNLPPQITHQEKPIDPEERERVAKKMAEFAKSFRLNTFDDRHDVSRETNKRNWDRANDRVRSKL